MRNNVNSKEKQPKIVSEMEIDFGTRKLNTQNFSKTVVLPKEALVNCGCNMNSSDILLDIKLVQEKGQRYIKLIPVCKIQTKNGDGNV